MSVESTLRHALILKLYECLDIIDALGGVGSLDDGTYSREMYTVDHDINHALDTLKDV